MLLTDQSISVFLKNRSPCRHISSWPFNLLRVWGWYGVGFVLNRECHFQWGGRVIGSSLGHCFTLISEASLVIVLGLFLIIKWAKHSIELKHNELASVWKQIQFLAQTKPSRAPTSFLKRQQNIISNYQTT